MRNAFLVLALSAALPVLAQTSTRPTFPDDFTPSPCAPEGTCKSYDRSQMKNAAFTMLALQLDEHWVLDHWDQMMALYAPVCRKHATCLATPGNNFLFCDDILIREYRAVCDRNFPKSANAVDNDQCKAFTEIWALGVDMGANDFAERGQACAKEKGLDAMHTKPPIVWIEPSPIPRDYKGDVYVYAIDPDTHVPVRADITVENQIFYTSANPAGNIATGYPWKWSKYNRVKRADGHEDVVAPMLTIRSEVYPEVQVRIPSTPPAMIVEMTPAKLHAGVNKVTVSAKDAETGKPVEARVYTGLEIAGETNTPIEITVPKGGKAPEVWVTSLFDAYSDVVVSPSH